MIHIPEPASARGWIVPDYVLRWASNRDRSDWPIYFPNRVRCGQFRNAGRRFGFRV